MINGDSENLDFFRWINVGVLGDQEDTDYMQLTSNAGIVQGLALQGQAIDQMLSLMALVDNDFKSLEAQVSSV